jgi:hypothetical protein
VVRGVVALLDGECVELRRRRDVRRDDDDVAALLESARRARVVRRVDRLEDVVARGRVLRDRELQSERRRMGGEGKREGMLDGFSEM